MAEPLPVIQGERDRQASDLQKNTEPFAVPVRIIDDPELAERALDRENRADKHDADDLQAQQDSANAAKRSADAAEWQSVTAAWQTGLTFIGTLFLALSVYFSARATKHASDAAQAAQDSIRADRAWMFHTSHNTTVGRGGFLDGKAVSKMVGIDVTWKNSGRTPAVNVRFHTDHKLAEPKSSPPTFHVGADEMSRMTTLGPGEMVKSVTRFISDGELDAWQRGEIAMFFYSKASYSDIFDTLRITEVCAEVYFRGFRHDPDGSAFPYVDFSPIGPQNTAS